MLVSPSDKILIIDDDVAVATAVRPPHAEQAWRRRQTCAVLARIGFREIRDLVEATWINNCFTVKDPRYHRQLVRIWRHSVARAIAMRALANARNLDGGPAYLAGLFADVGACVLLWIGAEKGSGGSLPDPESILPTIRLHHVKIGADLLRSWGYGSLRERVRGRHRHRPDARHGSRHHRRHVRPDSRPLDRCRQELGLSEAALAQMVDRLEPEIAAVLAAIE